MIGRPTDYNEKIHNEQGYRYALLGYTVKEIAAAFGLSLSTIKSWFRAHPDFLAAVTRGREYADAQVAEGLFKRATGFTVSEEKFFVVSDGNFTTRVERVQAELYYPPEPGAALNWLKNRQPDKWRDKIDIGLPPIIELTMNLEGTAPKPEEE